MEDSILRAERTAGYCVLPYLLGPARAQLECLWIGRDHRAAMGEDMVRRIFGGRHRHSDRQLARPDVGTHVVAHARRFEAVFVVSNEHVRDDVARVCRELDIPCYGPTFDS